MSRKLSEKSVLSPFGFYARAIACFPVGGTKPAKAKWLDNHVLLIDSAGRAFTEVWVRGAEMIMDAVTGSLYHRETGDCLSSDVLKVSGLRARRHKAQSYLMKLKRKPSLAV